MVVRLATMAVCSTTNSGLLSSLNSLISSLVLSHDTATSSLAQNNQLLSSIKIIYYTVVLCCSMLVYAYNRMS